MFAHVYITHLIIMELYCSFPFNLTSGHTMSKASMLPSKKPLKINFAGYFKVNAIWLNLNAHIGKYFLSYFATPPHLTGCSIERLDNGHFTIARLHKVI